GDGVTRVVRTAGAREDEAVEVARIERVEHPAEGGGVDSSEVERTLRAEVDHEAGGFAAGVRLEASRKPGRELRRVRLAARGADHGAGGQVARPRDVDRQVQRVALIP